MVKKRQLIMVWLLPIILIGGIFFPILGYLVVGMMAFFLVLSFFKGRFWCWNLCPRGAFLDIVMPKFSMNRAVPRFLTKPIFRWSIFFILMVFLLMRLFHSGKDLLTIGAIFVSMCIITSLISIVVGVFTKSRGWCMFCPMGTLQEKIGALKKK